MDRVFSDIKAKKSEALSDNTISDETLSLKGLDLKLLDEAIETANSKRRMIGVWSPTIAAAMWYLKGTIPNLISDDFLPTSLVSRRVESPL